MAQVPTVITASTGFLVCDAVIDAQFEQQVEATEHAIEDGSVITDHLVRKPQTLSMTLVATQTPLAANLGPSTTGMSVQGVTVQLRSTSKPGRQQTKLQIRQRQGVQLNVGAAVSAGLGALKRAVGAGDPDSVDGMKAGTPSSGSFTVQALAADTPSDRVNDFFSLLLGFALSGERLKIAFKGLEYENFVLTSVTKSDSAGQGGKSTFPVTFKQILTVQTKQVALPKVPAQKQTKDLGAKGGQYGPPLPPAESERLKSTLASTADAVTG